MTFVAGHHTSGKLSLKGVIGVESSELRNESVGVDPKGKPGLDVSGLECLEPAGRPRSDNRSRP